MTEAATFLRHYARLIARPGEPFPAALARAQAELPTIARLARPQK
jgi:hypothetical protein